MRHLAAFLFCLAVGSAAASDALVMSNGSSRIVTIVDTSGGIITADDGGQRITVSKLVVTSMLYNGVMVNFRNGLAVESVPRVEVVDQRPVASSVPEPLAQNPSSTVQKSPEPLQIEEIDHTIPRQNETRDKEGYTLSQLQEKQESFSGLKHKGITLLCIGGGLCVVSFVIRASDLPTYSPVRAASTVFTAVSIPLMITGSVLTGIGAGKSREYGRRVHDLKGQVGFTKTGDFYAGIVGGF